MIMLNQTNQAMDIVADILADEQENTISSYQYNGVELTPVEPVTMRNTFLLTIFNPASFLILRADKDGEIEYDEFQALLEKLLARGITHNNQKYHVLGASSSLKDGKLWMATGDVIESIHCYFESAQEALAYLGIYTSNNNHGIFEVEHQIKVVDDGYQVEGNLITGDGAGFAPKSVLKKLSVKDRQIQVRLHGEDWIAKGTLHPYSGNKLIIPKSMVKGKGMPNDGYQYFLLGIREIARELSFSSSWTLLQFFSEDTIRSTVPRLNAELNKLSGVLTNTDRALEFLGSIEDEERFKLESFLKAGLPPTHPYLTNALKKHLKKRYRDLALGSVVDIKGYMAAIADIPDNVICCVDKPMGEFVLTRYPIRDYKSFIVVKNDPTLVEGALSGSVYVNNNTILQLDGDYDGDFLAIVDDKIFNVEVSTNGFGNDYKRLDEGTKTRKKDSLKLLPFVASEALIIGNQVGYITYLINAAILGDKHEYLPELSLNLQLEVQSLKWSTQFDRNAIKKIADELDIVETFRECKFNKKAFVTHVPDVPEFYMDEPLFIPFNIVKERFQSLGKGEDLLSFRYDLPIYDYDIAKYQSESSSVLNLYHSWVADIIESYGEDDDSINDALSAPISFLERWSQSKVEGRNGYACSIWALVHRRSNGVGIGSAAFHVFEDEILQLLGKEPKVNTTANVKPNGLIKTLTAVGGYYDMPGGDNWSKLNTFRHRVKEMGRQVTVEVKQNPVDEYGKDFFVDSLRLGSLPKDQFALYGDIQVGDSFEAIITQKSKALYLHTL
jgi:hypothetical protein